MYIEEIVRLFYDAIFEVFSNKLNTIRLKTE